MHSIIDRARKGNSDAMTELFNTYKSKVYFLCASLLGDNKVTNNTVIAVFNDALEEIFNGRIDNETQYRDYLYKKAASFCWQAVKHELDVFKVKDVSNIARVYQDADSMNLKGETIDVVLNNQPKFHKFICMLYYIFEFDKYEISNITHVDSDSIGIIIDSDEIQINKIVRIIEEKTSTNIHLTADEFHKEVRQRAEKKRVPMVIDKAISQDIENISIVLCEKKKRKGIRFAVIASCLVIIIGSITKFLN